MDTLVNIRYKSDFEKLLFAESYIKELKLLSGKDASYIQELEYRIKELETKQNTPLTPEEKTEIKRGEFYNNLKLQLKDKSKKIETLSKQVKSLTNEIIKLKVNG